VIDRTGQIPLTRGYYATVDHTDLPLLLPFSWHLHKSDSKHWYAVNKQAGYMHRFLLGITDPKIVADHIDGNGLNNTRANIRIVTHLVNIQRGKWSAGISGKSGAQFGKGKWEARIRIGNGKRLYLGRFDTPEAASAAYFAAKEQYHGD
jgi:hypothetical protein